MKTRYELTVIAHKAAKDYAKKMKMRKDLCGLCMITSMSLYHAMLNHDRDFGTSYKPRVYFGRYSGSCHCWVESGGDVYDATYSQFSVHPIWVGKKSPWHQCYVGGFVNERTFVLVEKRQKPTEKKLKNFLKRMEVL